MNGTAARRRWRKTLIAAALLAATPAAQAASLLPPAAGPCSLENTGRATIARIEANFDIVLADGRTLTLAGLDPPRETPDHPRLAAEARDKLAAWLEGRDVALIMLAEKPNRWARIPARLFAAPPGAASGAEIGVAEAIIDAGLARYRPDVAAHPCRDLLLGAEAEARAEKVGLWGDPYYAVLAGSDRAAFASPSSRMSGMVLVEGAPASVGETAARFYLNFGPGRGVDFAITLPKRSATGSANSLEKAGIKPRDLVGRRLRARGLLDATFGPQMEISDPDGLELLD
jgi:endonuclease YncB( thermonuclease family)